MTIIGTLQSYSAMCVIFLTTSVYDLHKILMTVLNSTVLTAGGAAQFQRTFQYIPLTNGLMMYLKILSPIRLIA